MNGVILWSYAHQCSCRQGSDRGGKMEGDLKLSQSWDEKGKRERKNDICQEQQSLATMYMAVINQENRIENYKNSFLGVNIG